MSNMNGPQGPNTYALLRQGDAQQRLEMAPMQIAALQQQIKDMQANQSGQIQLPGGGVAPGVAPGVTLNSAGTSQIYNPTTGGYTPAPNPSLFDPTAGRFGYTKYAANSNAHKNVLSNVNGASVAGALAQGGVLPAGYQGAPAGTPTGPIEVPRTDWSGLWQLALSQMGGNNSAVPGGGIPGTSLGVMR